MAVKDFVNQLIRYESGNGAVMSETGHLNDNNSIQQHGGDIYRNQVDIDYSVNTNPLGPPEGVLEVLRTKADQIVHYPDMHCETLKKKLAEFEGISEREILCGNGAAELIYGVVQALRPKKALLTLPAFSEYELALQTAGAECICYFCKEAFDFQIQEDFLEQITEEIDLLFLCNPGNPVGQVIEKSLLIQILDCCRECGVIVVLDECFTEFLKDPQLYEMTGLRGAYPNLLLLKAFTKIFCMPGLRLGYLIASDQKLLQRIRKMLQPWNVSVLAQLCGAEALIDGRQYLEETRMFLEKEKTHIIKAMQELQDKNLTVYGSRANYIFFKGPKGLYEQALKERLLIRDCGNYPGLLKKNDSSTGYYRVAVRSQRENERLIAWLRKL